MQIIAHHLFCVFPQRSAWRRHSFLPDYYTQTLEEGIELAVEFEGPKNNNVKICVVLPMKTYQRSLEGLPFFLNSNVHNKILIEAHVHLVCSNS